MRQIFDVRGEKVVPLGIYSGQANGRPKSLLRYPTEEGGTLAEEVDGMYLTLTVYVFSPLLVPCTSRIRLFHARIEDGELASVQSVYDPFSDSRCPLDLVFGAFTAPSANTIPLFFNPLEDEGQYRTLVTAGQPLDYRLVKAKRPLRRYRDESAPVYVMPFYPSGFRAAGRVCLPCTAAEEGCTSITDCIRSTSHTEGRRGNNSKLVASMIGGKVAREYRIENGRVVTEDREWELSKLFIAVLSVAAVGSAAAAIAALTTGASSSRRRGRPTQRSSRMR